MDIGQRKSTTINYCSLHYQVPLHFSVDFYTAILIQIFCISLLFLQRRDVAVEIQKIENVID